MMPGMDGYDLVTSVKNNKAFSHIPVVLLSARADERSVEEAMALGADDYLQKPFSSRELVAFVRARLALAGKQQ
jgi:DNA-binding response OmpR family regulator